MLNDLRLGLRLFWKDKAFSLTAVLTLAVCIGANTALFSVVDHVLLRPLPFHESERMLLMANQYPGAGVELGGQSGAADYYDRLRETTVFSEQAMYNSSDVSVDQNGTPTRVRVMNVTPSFFRLLGIAPQYGRIFQDSEGEIGSENKVLLSHALWQSAFGGDPQVIGRDIRVDGQPYAVVGILPRSFSFLRDDVMLWRPLAFTPQRKEQRHSNNWFNIGRLKPGATLQQAQEQIDALNRANLDRFPQYKQLLINARFSTTVLPLQQDLVRSVKPTLYLLWAGALFVLLIGCVNVANLVLVRSRARLKELATRLALGAGRGRVARQLVTEGVLLTLMSAALGLLAGHAILQVLASLNMRDLPRGFDIRIDASVISYTLGISTAIGLVLGLIPVAAVLPANLTTVLRDEGRGGTSGRGARTLRRSLVVAQVGFAFVLLIGAGLLFASFRRLLAVDPGFVADRVLTASINLPRSRYPDEKALNAFAAESLRRLRALPGVSASGATDTIPFGGQHSDSVILAEGHQMRPGESVISPQHGRQRRLFRGDRRETGSRPILRRARRPRRAEGDHRRRETGAAVLAQSGSDRAAHVPAAGHQQSTRHQRQNGVLLGHRRRARYQARRSRVGQRRSRRVLLPDGAGFVATSHLRGEGGHRSVGCSQLGSRGDSQPGSRAARV
jgi:predicted permease